MLSSVQLCLILSGVFSLALGRPEVRLSPKAVRRMPASGQPWTPLERSAADDGDNNDHIHEPTPVYSTISMPTSTGAPPAEVTAGVTQLISTNSYWWIDGSCGYDTTPDGDTKYDYLKQAFTNATEIANVAKQWPAKFTGSSDYYVAKGFDPSKYADDFQKNLANVGGWQSDRDWPLQSYVRVACDDLYGACNGKIGNDPRPVGAYAKDTKGTFGERYWRITACKPFWTRNTVAQVKRFHESVDPADMQMIFMETSGSAFLHEAMHLTAITEKRDQVIDATFDGGMRIYGTRAVAKAARIASRDGFDIVRKNADSYAVFAMAAYWENYYGRVIPPFQSGKAAPAGIFEDQSVQDSQDNYVDILLDTSGSGGNGDLPQPAATQQIALASYINPLADPTAWDRIISYNSSKISLLVANVVNGPDIAADRNWTAVIQRSVASGKIVIGYVRTGYLGVSKQAFKTRLGSGNLADWTAQIERDVDLWYQLYPGMIGGIFFDEGWNDCGDNNEYAELYRLINENTKRKYPGAYTVLNPGDFMPKCFEHSADTLLTFESSFTRYMDESVYKPNGWTASDPRKNWHIVYGVPEDQIEKVIAKSKERGAGYIEVTDDVMDNPYDNLPADSYMKSQMALVSGGAVLPASPLPASGGGGPSSFPRGFNVDSFDYSSVSLSWPAVSGVGSFRFDFGSSQIVLQGSMTGTTISVLSPGETYTFVLTAIAPDGDSIGVMGTQTVTTKSLPGGRTVANLGMSQSDSSSSYSADIYTPYAFTRIYIWDSDESCEWDISPGWPINFAQANYVCTKFMVEGEKLYKYSGKWKQGQKDAEWAWSQIGTVNVTQSGYTYSWTLPIGSSTIDTTKFAVQVQGYGPAADVIKPCPLYGGGPDGQRAYCA